MIDNKEKNFISAVIYVHNNENEIEDFINRINVKLYESFSSYEIICVNDCSTDDSVERIKSMSDKITDVAISVINMSSYHGKELAMNSGIDLAIGDFVYEFDSVHIDYDLDKIIEVYKCAINNGYDVVSASSNGNKRIMSRLFYMIFNGFSKSKSKINAETFRIISRRAINRVKSMSKSIPYRKVIYANCGLNTSSIQYDVISTIDKKMGKVSREEKKCRKELAIDSMILFTDFFYKLAVFMSFSMMLVILCTIAYTIYIFICQKPIAGWTTMMLLMSFAFFGIFTILTIMIKYLTIVIDLIFKKQKYLISSIDKITRDT